MGLSAQLLTREGGVAFKAEEDYDITSSAWIDATLDQGVWCDMQALLLLPGLAMVMDHDIHFAFSQFVPCIEGVGWWSILTACCPMSPRPGGTGISPSTASEIP
jgi:hypothetical protein